MPRKSNALREQVGHRQNANVSLRLNAKTLKATKVNRAKKDNNKGKTETYFERTFVRVLRERLSQWNIELWLDNDTVRGTVPDKSNKIAAQRALELEAGQKVCGIIHGLEGCRKQNQH